MTGSEIKGLKIGDERIGNLNVEEQTDYITYKEFHFDSGHPIEPIKAKIDYEILTDNYFSDCGTERYSIKEGLLEIEIRKWDHDNKTYLQLDLK